MTYTLRDLKEIKAAIAAKQAKVEVDLRRGRSALEASESATHPPHGQIRLTNTLPLLDDAGNLSTQVMVTQLVPGLDVSSLAPGTIIEFKTSTGKRRFAQVIPASNNPYFKVMLKEITQREADRLLHHSSQPSLKLNGREVDDSWSNLLDDIDPMKDIAIRIGIVAMVTLLLVMVVALIFQLIFEVDILSYP